MSDALPPGLVEDDRSFVLDILDERAAVERELGELDVIIQQNSSEYEAASQRLQRAQTAYKEYEPRLDSLPRDELRRLLTAVSQAELRHAVVGEQRERLAEKQEAQRKLLLVIDFALKLAPLAGLPLPASEEDLLRQRQALAQREGEAAKRGGAGVGASDGGAAAEPHGADLAASALVRIIQAQEDERQRLAREMHDGPAQSMTNLILRAELCERLVKLQPERAATELAELKNMVNNTLQETRQFIFDVRPMILDDLGLVPAVRRYVDEINQKGSGTVIVTVKGPERRLPSPLEIVLFRIIQDALKVQDVRGHDKSTQVVLTLGAREVQLAVHYPQPSGATRGAASGTSIPEFESIGRRVATIGGKLDVEEAAPHVILRIALPVPPSSERQK